MLQPRTKPVETHYKNTYFLYSSWQKCLPSQIKRPFPPSPIAVFFAVTQEMHTWAVQPKQHCTRGGKRGDFVPFRLDGCMARNWKTHGSASTVLSGVVVCVNYAHFSKQCRTYASTFYFKFGKNTSITMQQTSIWQTHLPYLHLEL